VQEKHETILFKSYSKNNTFGIIIKFLTLSLSILYFFKNWHWRIVEGHYIYQSPVTEMTFIEMWRQRIESGEWAESAYITGAGS
jgi:hypothetical protein